MLFFLFDSTIPCCARQVRATFAWCTRATWRTSYANFARNICVTYARHIRESGGKCCAHLPHEERATRDDVTLDPSVSIFTWPQLLLFLQMVFDTIGTEKCWLNLGVSWLQRSNSMEIANLGLKFDVLNREVSSSQMCSLLEGGSTVCRIRRSTSHVGVNYTVPMRLIGGILPRELTNYTTCI
jgi:hypothetical protein